MNKVKVLLLGLVEKAGTTFSYTFAVVLMATGSAGVVTHQAWFKAADTAGFAALLAVGTTLVTLNVDLRGGADVVFRVVKTFAQSFFGVLVADATSSLIHAGWKGALAVAVPATLFSALKALIAWSSPHLQGSSLIPVAVGPAIKVAGEPAPAVA